MARALLIQGYKDPLRILCTREVQRTIAESVHQLLSDQISALGLSPFYAIQKDKVEGLNGTLFSFAGLKDLSVANLKSYEGYDRVWVEEAEKTTKKSWEVLIPTIRKTGSEIWVNFNPQLDTDETYMRFIVKTPPDCRLIPMSWRDNPWFPEVLEKERQFLEKSDPVAYENVWEGKCRTAVDGAIYASEIRDAIESRRIRPVPYDPLLKVHTVWDLGWNDRTSIIFVQRLHSEIRVIDFLEDQFKTYDWYAAELKNKRYNYGKAWLPHDGGHKSMQTGLSAYEILKKLGIDTAQPLPKGNVESEIKLTRQTFPRVFFDEVKAAPLVEHLKRYRRHIPTTTQEPSTPLHDEHSHAADALRYMAVCAPMISNDSKDKPLPLPKTGIV